MGWNADAHDDIVPCEFGTFVRYADYLTLAQQRDAAVRERESALELAAADERRLFARIEEVRTLRARLAACERVGETAAVRFGILRDRMAACDADTGDDVHELSMTEIPWWIDDLRAVLTTPPLDDDDGPNDGHARTVRRTPPQDAATTRGEG
jgi:hypothetical protein